MAGKLYLLTTTSLRVNKSEGGDYIQYGNQYEFTNANGHINTKGMETNFCFTYNNLKLVIAYTYADANSHFRNIRS